VNPKQVVGIGISVLALVALVGSDACAVYNQPVSLSECSRDATLIVVADVASVEYVGDTVYQRIWGNEFELSTRRAKIVVQRCEEMGSPTVPCTNT
jgi:hypothetical protein